MFKKNFERICAERGVSPTKAVKAVGLAESAYPGWTETSVPRNSTLLKLANYLNVTVDDLLRDDLPSEVAAEPSNSQEQSLLDAFRSLPPATQAALLALVQTWEGDGRKQYP